MDVVIIGGGYYGTGAAREFADSGHGVVLIEQDVVKCESLVEAFAGVGHVKIVPGKGFVASLGRVMVLNPDSGDERQPINFSCLVIACGGLSAEDSGGRFIGLSKLGGNYDAVGRIEVGADGSTGVASIFAVGGCATLDAGDPVEATRAILGAESPSVGGVV